MPFELFLMQKFKEHWQITENWQLIFPIAGIIGLGYSSYKLAKLITGHSSVIVSASLALLLTFISLKLCLFIFKKLETKWVVDQRWEIIRIFIVFAITGSSSLLVGRPIIQLLGITKENLNLVIYYVLFMFISLIFYQVFLLVFAWLLGQFKFFWEFEKKMLSRLGFKFPKP